VIRCNTCISWPFPIFCHIITMMQKTLTEKSCNIWSPNIIYVHIVIIPNNKLPTFFSWLPFCPSKICLEVPRHILVLPIHTLSHVMHVLGLERILLDHYKPKTFIIWSKVCLIVYKKWIKQRAANKKEKKKPALLYCLQ